jgi:phosphoribosylglycinamide formyltransferase-1
MGKIRVGVLASGKGTDFQSIIDAVKSGRVDADLCVLISDNPAAMALERAKNNNIPAICINPKDYTLREEHDRAVRKKLDEFNLDLVVLAGYMRFIHDKKFLEDYKGRMINVHPSLLPSFPGASPHPQTDAFNSSAKLSGCSIHFVDATHDGGSIIYQEAVDISDCKNAEEVIAKILGREHVVLPLIVNTFSRGKYTIKEKKVGYVRF